jgi:hypothetical protein
MADENLTESLPVDRVSVAREAIWQLDSLVNMLKREKDRECFEFVLASTLIRMKELSSVVMSVIAGDDARETSEMEEVVHG